MIDARKNKKQQELSHLYFKKLSYADQKLVREYLVDIGVLTYSSQHLFVEIISILRMDDLTRTINYIKQHCVLVDTYSDMTIALEEIRKEIGI